VAYIITYFCINTSLSFPTLDIMNLGQDKLSNSINNYLNLYHFQYIFSKIILHQNL